MAKRETETEHKIEEFAEDLGRLLGTARAKAEGWMGQRQAIVKTLTGLRDEATKLLSDLGHQAQSAVRQGRRGRPAAQKSTESVYQPQPGQRKRRKMSAAARKAISDAQKARWAKQKAGKK